MPLLETKGAASAQGFGEFAKSGPANYIEDVFSTYLYTGNGSSQTITNNIDISGKGALVWFKNRGAAADHLLVDTARGFGTNLTGSAVLRTNLTNAQSTGLLTAYNPSATGFTIFNDSAPWSANVNNNTYVSWTFRKQPKFFDVVLTTTGTGGSFNFNHSLGSVPGCVIFKRVDSTGNWIVAHRSLGNSNALVLNGTGAQVNIGWSFSTDFTSTSVNIPAGILAGSDGNQWIAYLFAHDAGGFGLTGTDNVISCGSYTGNSSTNGPIVTLGYEPQWVLIKAVDSVNPANWIQLDIMRGFSEGTIDSILSPNASSAEYSAVDAARPLATGFQITSTAVLNGGDINTTGQTYIYIAIRRGPMKVPTSGTSVFSPITYAGNGTGSRVISGLINAPDWVLYTARNASAGLNSHITGSRLQGGGRYLLTEGTGVEASTAAYGVQTYGQTSVTLGTATTAEQNASGVNYILYGLGRAPGFFDVVCYTGTGSNTTQAHNLGVVPELMIVKRRSDVAGWRVWTTPFGATDALDLNTDAAKYNGDVYWGPAGVGGTPTASVFSVGTNASTNASGSTYVAYLFATCAGVSKVGSYTGTGALQTVNCGFTGGARFVLIKRTDSTGDWYVYDSARGISSGNDPYLFLNSTAAEVTGTNYVDTTSVGFQVTAAAPAGLNANGGTYIFLAIA